MVWFLLVLVTIMSMKLAASMATARRRSAKPWIWAAAVIGPFAPAALFLLRPRGDHTVLP